MTAKAWAFPVFDPGGIATQRTTADVDIIQTVGMHDVAIITLRGEDMTAPYLRPGTPVRITYGWNPVELENFYGYIDHIEASYEKATPDNMHYDDVVCVGVSYVLKDPFVGAWSATRASTLVQQLANQYYLSTLLETDDTLWPQLSSPGCSGWEFLCSMATKLGYVLACNKSLLRFISVEQTMNQNQAIMPTFYSRNSARSVSWQTISNFQSTQGEAFQVPGKVRASRTAGGIDQRTGQVVKVTDNGVGQPKLATTAPFPFFGRIETGLVISDQSHAKAALAGMAQKNRFQYYATATLSGDTAVVQGAPIVVTGINSKDDGVWWVEEVQHKFAFQHYTMKVSLGRDSSGDNGVRPSASPAVVYNPKDPFHVSRSSVPPTVLVNRRWRAAYQASVQVAGAA